MSRRRTSVQIASGIEPKQKKKSKKITVGEMDRKKSKKITGEEIGEKIGKGISAIRRANIAIEKWADSPELIPVETLKKGKGVVGRTYRGYKRAQKAEEEYAERLEKGIKAHDKRAARMNKLVKML